MMNTDQNAFATGSSKAVIQRVVNQGNMLSAIVFNYILYITFDMRRAGLANEGIAIAHRLSRFNNIKYVDDTSLYAQSLDELMQMIIKLHKYNNKQTLRN